MDDQRTTTSSYSYTGYSFDDVIMTIGVQVFLSQEKEKSLKFKLIKCMATDYHA